VPETAQSFAARDVPHLAAKPREAFPDPSIELLLSDLARMSCELVLYVREQRTESSALITL